MYRRKHIETPDDMISHLQDFISEMVEYEKDRILGSLETANLFERGHAAGALYAYDELRQYLRRLSKDGYTNLTIEDWDIELHERFSEDEVRSS